MSQPTSDIEYELVETRLEQRDGGTWVNGFCAYCWERVAILEPSGGEATTIRCPNGHRLRVTAFRSEGASRYLRAHPRA